jgi:hypothetical protein
MRVALSLPLAAVLAAPTPVFAGNKGKKAHDAPSDEVRTSQTAVALITV